VEKSDGDAPVTDIDMSALPGESGAAAPDLGVLTLHAHVLRQLREAQRGLLAVRNLSSLARYLLDDLPAAFATVAAELRLHDPEGTLAPLLPARRLFGQSLTLHRDSYPLYELFEGDPVATVISLDDPRMFQLLSAATSASGAVLMPLMDGNRLIGTYHLALTEEMQVFGEHDLELFSMLGQLIASTVLRVVDYQRVDQLSLLDPVTEVGNLRAFRRDLLREIFWARRVSQPLSLLFIALDDLDEVSRSYGEVTSNFVQRRVSQRLCSDLRSTDYIAHIAKTHFAILLPACSEPHAHDIGERMRRDIDNFPIDDGRGAVLYVSLSIGLVCWEPARFPMEASDRLAQQLETEAEGAMGKAVRAGGNRISVARLGLLMV
jgi:diguanylate cyclase (GGDEF)-like protein